MARLLIRNRAIAVACLSVLILGAGWLTASVAAENSDSAQRDARAVDIAKRSLDAMGGEQAWQDSRFFRFNFFGVRTHHWDRYTGLHRLEGKSREGVSYVVLHDIDTREGDVWLDGERATGDAHAEWLERAYGAWINDTYWLLMPYKLLDPGVNLAYDGEQTLDGATYDKLKLSFHSVGLTPGDTYWAYINRDTGLMDRWAYHLEDWEADRPATQWQWLDWQRHGDIMLSSRRIETSEGREASLGDIAVMSNLAESTFTSPEPLSGAAE